MKHSNESLTILLFEATCISGTTLFGELKQGAKRWFNLWFNQGKNLAKQLNIEIKAKEFADAADFVYNEDAAYIYDLAYYGTQLSTEDKEKLIGIIKSMILNNEIVPKKVSKEKKTRKKKN